MSLPPVFMANVVIPLPATGGCVWVGEISAVEVGVAVGAAVPVGKGVEVAVGEDNGVNVAVADGKEVRVAVEDGNGGGGVPLVE